MNSYEKIIRWPLSIRFWETGRIYARGRIENGLRQDQWTFYYRSGAAQMAGEYKDGVKQGVWTKWWKNGEKASQGAFIDGKMDGRWIDWYDSGAKAQESHWARGKRTGKATVWDRETGKVIKTVSFDESQEPVMDFTLLTDRDAAYALAKAQKANMARSWGSLVGDRIARYTEPWHWALCLLAFIPIFKLASESLGTWAVPVSVAIALGFTAGVVFAGELHDHATRPDYGAKE